MQNLQGIHVLSQFAAERATLLRSKATLAGLPRRPMRRWLGEQLVRLGAWVAAEPALRPTAPG